MSSESMIPARQGDTLQWPESPKRLSFELDLESHDAESELDEASFPILDYGEDSSGQNKAKRYYAKNNQGQTNSPPNPTSNPTSSHAQTKSSTAMLNGKQLSTAETVLLNLAKYRLKVATQNADNAAKQQKELETCLFKRIEAVIVAEKFLNDALNMVAFYQARDEPREVLHAKQLATHYGRQHHFQNLCHKQTREKLEEVEGELDHWRRIAKNIQAEIREVEGEEDTAKEEGVEGEDTEEEDTVREDTEPMDID